MERAKLMKTRKSYNSVSASASSKILSVNIILATKTNKLQRSFLTDSDKRKTDPSVKSPQRVRGSNARMRANYTYVSGVFSYQAS